MPQANIFQPFVTPGNAQAPAQLDATGNLLVGAGSQKTMNVTAAAVIKTGPGRLLKVFNLAGTAGFTVNDNAATGGTNTAANQLYLISTTTVGQVVNLDVPFTTGLTVSAVGASGQLVVVYD